MLVDHAVASSLLGCKPEALVVEDNSTPSTAMHRISAPGAPFALCVRNPHDPEAAANEAAVLEALNRAGFEAAPSLLAVSGEATLTRWLESPPALGHIPPPAALDATVDALSALHALPLAEGLRWGHSLESMAGPPALPLHRLGFAAHEREAAVPALEQAHALLLASPSGFTHANLTAAHLHLTPAPVFAAWGAAGFGPQLLDLAALLWTLPLDSSARRTAVARYASGRSLDPATTIDAVDLLALRWGLEWLMALPRQQVRALGDDPTSARLVLAGSTIERAIREPVGAHPAAAALRRALWPG